MCYYFDDIIKFEYFDLGNILIEEKSNGKALVFNIYYINLIADKHLHVRFEKINGFIGDCDRTRYLVLFASEKYDSIYNRIRCYNHKK